MVDGHFEQLICTCGACTATVPAASGQRPDVQLQMLIVKAHAFAKILPVISQCFGNWLTAQLHSSGPPVTGISACYHMGRKDSSQKNTVGHPGL